MKTVLALTGLGLSASIASSALAPRLDRVRLIITSTAATTDVAVSGARIASYISKVLAGTPGLHSSQTGGTLQLSRNVVGKSAEAQFDIILADVAKVGNLTWNVTTDSTAPTQLEVYSLA